jgi:hypothetical protein
MSKPRRAGAAILVPTGQRRDLMRRFAALLFLLSTFGLAAVGAGAAAEGNGYGPWEPTVQAPITAPADYVCPFTVTAEPVRQDIRVRYHYDAAGNVDGYQATGQLFGRITNEETGASVVRNLSGPGTVTFNADGSYDAIVSGDFLVFFLPQDTPSSALLLLSGQTALHGAPNGDKTLVSLNGQVENLCDTLG